SPLQALATNKLQSSFGTASAVYAFARKGRIDFRRFARPAMGAFAGSMLGAFTLQRVYPAFLAGLVPVLLILMMIYFTFGPKASEEDRHSRFGPGVLVGVVIATGFYDGFFGPRRRDLSDHDPGRVLRPGTGVGHRPYQAAEPVQQHRRVDHADDRRA